MAAATVNVGTVYPAAIASSAVGDNTVPLVTAQEPNRGPRSLRVENYTAATIYLAYDKAASLGAHQVPAGQVYVDDNCGCQNLHVFTPAGAVSINGTASAAGVFIWGTY